MQHQILIMVLQLQIQTNCVFYNSLLGKIWLSPPKDLGSESTSIPNRYTWWWRKTCSGIFLQTILIQANVANTFHDKWKTLKFPFWHRTFCGLIGDEFEKNTFFVRKTWAGKKYDQKGTEYFPLVACLLLCQKQVYYDILRLRLGQRTL